MPAHTHTYTHSTGLYAQAHVCIHTHLYRYMLNFLGLTKSTLVCEHIDT